MKVPLSEQIDTLEYVADYYGLPPPHRLGMNAAISTLKWVEKHLAELRVLGEFPGATVVRRDEE